jgi:predicted AAA+ superfamily ATPase
MVNRILASSLLKSSKSILLLGPRQVGKSTLIRSLNPQLTINLADELEFLSHSSNPNELRQLIQSRLQSGLMSGEINTIFIDEVQRLPRILNTIQALTDENKQLKFYLTGSSARKLRRGQANLLPGRVFMHRLGTLIAAELNYQIDLNRALSIGTMPEIYLESNGSDAKHLLRSYVATYLKEEIKAEALVRNLESFSRFLTESVTTIGQFVDFSKLAHKAKISRHAVPRYFEILEDTLVGYLLSPFGKLKEEVDLIKHPKFFFFDVGIYNGLLGNLVPSADRIGALSEQLVFSQILHSAWAWDREVQISTFRTRQGIEVDFIVELDQSVFGIEVKSSDQILSSDLGGLLEFGQLYPSNKGLYVFHLGEREKKIGPVWCLPLTRGLKELGL